MTNHNVTPWGGNPLDEVDLDYAPDRFCDAPWPDDPPMGRPCNPLGSPRSNERLVDGVWVWDGIFHVGRGLRHEGPRAWCGQCNADKANQRKET